MSESKRISTTKATTHTGLMPGDIDVPAGVHRYYIEALGSNEVTYRFHLRHSGTELSVVGKVDATGKESPILSTTVAHHAPHTSAETIVRTLSRDAATPRFSGMIRIEKNASDVTSYLNHHSLLLGETAQSWTTPSLEILNNEVKCSHAATVKTITPLDLFYLESRGLSAAESENLFITTFFADVQS